MLTIGVQHSGHGITVHSGDTGNMAVVTRTEWVMLAQAFRNGLMDQWLETAGGATEIRLDPLTVAFPHKIRDLAPGATVPGATTGTTAAGPDDGPAELEDTQI